MDLAIKEAIKAASEDEVPVGCVIVTEIDKVSGQIPQDPYESRCDV